MAQYWARCGVGFVLAAVSFQARAEDYRAVDREVQAHNAARLDRGGRIRLELLGAGVVKDRQTSPEDVIDGNVHSRQVVTGAPYRFHMELVDELPIEAIHLICSDYDREVSPKDVEVTFADGTVFRLTLARLPARRGQAKPRQTLTIGGKRARSLDVTIVNNHTEGASAQGAMVGWGGIGEIEVVTSADLSSYLTVADFNPALPQDIRSASPRRDYSAVHTRLPEAIPLGQRPGIYATAAGWQELFATMKASPRGRPTYDNLISMADSYAGSPIVHPDPNVPAQVRDRGDEAARAHDALSKQAGIEGYAYRMTGKLAYAERVRQILLGYARLYPNEYKEHKGVNNNDTSKVMAQRLSEAMWLIPLIQAYDLAGDASCFLEADRTLIQEDLIRQAITFIHGKTSAAQSVAANDAANPAWRTDPATRNPRGGPMGNWTAFYTMAYIQGGCVLADQDWIDLGAAGLKTMLENGIGDDGMWGEGAIGYQQFARHAMVGGLETLARHGIDLWSYKNHVFKNLFDAEFSYAYPDGTSPGINDSGRAPVGSGWTAMAFDYAYLRYGDPNYARTINATGRQLHPSPACYFPTLIYATLPEVPVVGQSSLVFDSLGYAILRGRDAGGETFLLMDYGPHGGVHGHPDKLNLILFADGDELAGEPHFFRYEDELHPDWTRPSIAHWTLSIDEHSQNPTSGRLLCFADAGDIKTIRAQAEGVYAGVALDRAVVQMPGYVVDIYRAWGPAEHTFDYPLSFPGRLDLLVDVADAALVPMSDLTPGYRHIRAVGPLAGEGTWTGVWERDADPGTAAAGRRGTPANHVRAQVLPGASGTQVWLGSVPGQRHQAVLRRSGTEAVFAAVIDPFRDTDAVTAVESLQVAGPVRAAGVRVLRADGGTDLIVVRYDPMEGGVPGAPSHVAGLTTQALLTVVRLDRDSMTIGRLNVGGDAVP